MASNNREYEGSINYKSISCENIPELFLDKITAKNHFSKFGKISKFILRPNRLQCTVDYESEEDAKMAILNGCIYNGHEFGIKFTETETAQVRNTEEWVDADIQSELEAMSNSSHKQYRTPLQLAQQSLFTSKLQQSGLRLPKPILKSKTNSFNVGNPAPLEPINIETRNVELSSQNMMLKIELESIMKKPAQSAIEKCNVLDARDKYVRLTTVKTTDIKKAVSTKGTCPDMCPEKERWLRETRDQVSSFEMAADGNTMNHKIAVKEYSRSSADQEAPLAHELRPESVLKMTMTYLLHRIMNLCDDENTNIGDWFHFVWDRTRSIRKDITQQELCSVGVVELVEQCARFHIHCAARLVAEEPSVFDQKINTENLTKCLQSLKYMYHDLNIKNIKCPNEAEFRAYIVLLNLNDGNFLWEVKQLSDDIRKSKEMKEAIDFYLAIENNNFVKFFKMIRTTTYTNCCILMRYFNQVRNAAVRIIIKAYTSPRQVTIQVPLNYLMEILLFESYDDAATFFQHHGIDCDYEKVTLEKNWNYIPDTPLQLERYLEVIESKRSVSVGESICGKPLISPSIFENHQPQNSFDNNGYLKSDTVKFDGQTNNESHNKRSDSPASDNVFIVPMHTPPISPKQQQQQQQQIKSLFGLTSPKIIPENRADETDSSKSGSEVRSIFGLSKPSLVHSTGSVFDKPKPIEFEVRQPAISENNIFQQHLKSESKVSGFGQIKPPQNTEISKTESIFAIAKDSVFRDSKLAANNFSFAQQKPEPNSIFDVQKSQTGSIFSEKNKPTLKNQLGSHSNIFSGFTRKKDFTSVATEKQSEIGAEKFGSTNFGDNIFKNAAASKALFNRLGERSESTDQKKNLKRKSIPDENELQDNMHEEEYFSQKLPTIPQQLPTTIDDKINFEKEKLLEIEKQKLIEEKKILAEKESERKKHEEQIKLQNLKKIQQNADRILKEIMNEVQDNSIKSVVENTLIEIRINQMIALNAKRILQDLCNELIAESVKQIVQNELRKFTKNQLVLKKYFAKWRTTAIKSAERRHLIQKAHSWAMPDSIDVVAKKMAHPTQTINLSMIQRYRLGVPKVFDLPQIDACNKIDIFSILAKEFNDESIRFKIYGRLKSKKYLKFVISLPDDIEEIKGFNTYIESFLNDSIVRNKPSDSIKGFMCESVENFAICIQKISGRPNFKTFTQCDSSSGLVFFFTLANLSNTKKRLFNFCYNCKINKRIPITLLLYKTSYDNHQYDLEQILELDELQRLEKISDFKIIDINDQCLSEGVTNAFSFLAQNLNRPNPLEMQNSISFLQTTITDEIWKRFHDSWIINPAFQQYCTKPQNVVNLYNSTIQKLIDLFSEDLTQYSDFPMELKEFVPKLHFDLPKDIEYFPVGWQSPERKAKILNFLKKLRLKPIQSNWLTNIEDLEKEILSYSKKCIKIANGQSIPAAGYSAIQALLEKLNNSALTDLSVEDRIEQISWLEVIRPITLELLTHTWKTDHQIVPSEFIYRKNRYEKFTKVPWWLEELQAMAIKYKFDAGNQSISSNVSESSFKNFEYIDQENLDSILHRGYEAIERASDNIEKYNNYLHSSKEISKELDHTLYELETKKLKSMSSGRRKVDDEEFAALHTHKKFKQIEKGVNNDEVDDVIAKAMSVIEKFEMRKDVRKKFDI